MQKSQRQTFLEGALIMAAANIVVKLIGAFFKIPLKNLIGADGMGLFNTAYNIYSALVVISTAGLPVAVSRMVAESNALGKSREVERIRRVSFWLFIAIGLVSAAVMVLGSRTLVSAARNTRAYYAVLALSPAVFFVALMSIYRGYYQGLSNMIPTAMSQLIEAMCKLVLGYGLAYLVLRQGWGVEMAAAAAILGVTIGTVLGAAYLALRQRLSRDVRPLSDYNPQTRSPGELLRTLVRVAIPIMLGSAVLSLTNLIDGFVVIRRLTDLGLGERANYLYGVYSSMSVSLMTMPQTLIVGMTVSLIPAISAAHSQGNQERASRNAEAAMRLTGLLTFPCAAGLYTLAWPILNLLFSADVDMATPLLQTLSFAFIFVSLVSVSSAMLQAVGRELLPVISMFIGGVVKLAVNYTLIGIPDINISGAPIGTTLCYATIAVINIFFIYRRTRIGPKRWYTLYKPILAALVMGAAAYVLYPLAQHYVGAKLGVILVIGVCVVVYLAALLLLRGIVREDVLMLPKGAKLAKLLRL